MKFTKMHGLGNDYVYVDCTKTMLKDPEAVSRLVSDRHTGIGSDGLILICASDCADFRMAMYNADGSQGEMCGNGIRCVGKYVYDYGLTDRTHLTIETLAGLKYLDLTVVDGKVTTVRVDMGEPILKPSEIPADYAGDTAVAVPLEADGETYDVTCVSMGNPHAVLFVEDVDGLDLEAIGPSFENNIKFPNRTNTEIAKALDRHTVRMRVWERGSGETMACGTGACATAVASILNDQAESPVTVRLNGGDLTIEWDGAGSHVFMTGPAVTVFDGEMEI